MNVPFLRLVEARQIGRAAWYAACHQRRARIRTEQLTAPYADVTMRRYVEPLPVPGGADRLGWRSQTLRVQLQARKYAAWVAAEREARTQRLLELVAAEYVLPTRPADLYCLRESLQWVRAGESEAELARHAAERSRLLTIANAQS